MGSALRPFPASRAGGLLSFVRVASYYAGVALKEMASNLQVLFKSPSNW